MSAPPQGDMGSRDWLCQVALSMKVAYSNTIGCRDVPCYARPYNQ